jgi:hypothetical protein
MTTEAEYKEHMRLGRVIWKKYLEFLCAPGCLGIITRVLSGIIILWTIIYLLFFM